MAKDKIIKEGSEAVLVEDELKIPLKCINCKFYNEEDYVEKKNKIAGHEIIVKSEIKKEVSVDDQTLKCSSCKNKNFKASIVNRGESFSLVKLHDSSIVNVVDNLRLNIVFEDDNCSLFQPK